MSAKNAEYILKKLFLKANQNFEFKLWDGTSIAFGSLPHDFKIIFSDKGEFRKLMFFFNTFTIGSAYVRRGFDIEGDIVKAANLASSENFMKLSFCDRVYILLNLIML